MLEQLFKKALEEFFSGEVRNIHSGVSERNLCGRLSLPLERLSNEYGFKGYYADTEYNRKQDGLVKTILDDSYQIINITCDLILHSRGENMVNDNLIAIEMKKSERPEEEKVSDRARLRTLTKSSFDGVWSYDGRAHPEHVCGYELGYFIEIDRENSTYVVQEFKKGALVNEMHSRFGP